MNNQIDRIATEIKRNQEERRVLEEARWYGKLEGENYILKSILEQLLKIELIPKLKFNDE